METLFQVKAIPSLINPFWLLAAISSFLLFVAIVILITKWLLREIRR